MSITTLDLPRALRPLSAAVAVFTLVVPAVLAQTYRIETILGDFDPLEEVALAEAWTDWPSAVAADSEGSIYFAERGTNRIRRVDTFGVVSTIAGNGLLGFSGDGGPATLASLGQPQAIAVDGQGVVYIADTDNYRIRKVDRSGMIVTIAGSGEWGWGGDGGPATNAEFSAVYGLAADKAGNVYVADTWNDTIRKIDLAGNIARVVGTGEEGSRGDGGPAVEARLDKPRGVVVDAFGNIYVADSDNHSIRRIDLGGIISTVAGTGERGFNGDGGPAVEAALAEPQGVAVDSTGGILIADTRNRRVRRVGPDGLITTVAGRGTPYGGPVSGPGIEVALSSPRSLAIGLDGGLYIADSFRDLVFRLDPTGTMDAFVGWGRREPDSPGDVAVDGNGIVYVADIRNHQVLTVDKSGQVSNYAGTGEGGYSGDGGPAAGAKLFYPGGVDVDRFGNVYIADTSNLRVRRVAANGTIETIAGTGESGSSGDGGPATSATFGLPAALAVDAVGQVYVADTRNHRIRKIDSEGIITTIAGTGEPGDSGDGGPATEANVEWPEAVAVDGIGQVYFTSARANRIRMIDLTGTITTIAGGRESGFSGDGGPALSAQFDRPSGVAVGIDGSIYVGDTWNHTVRRIDSEGIISTIAGNGHLGYDGEGSPATEFQLSLPSQVAVDHYGSVYVVDAWEHRIRRLTPEDPPPLITSVLNGASFSGSLAPSAVAVLEGTELAPGHAAAPALPRSSALPTSLQGTSVIVADSNWERHLASLFMVSPNEIRFQVPEGAAEGLARVIVQRSGVESERLAIQLTAVAPGLFSANGDGRGVAAAAAVRIARDGTQTPMDVARYEPSLGRYFAVPLDLGSFSDRVYVRLHGTGIRGASGATLATIRGNPVRVESSGPSPGVHGVDEVVVGPLPRALSRRESDVVVIVDGQASNAVTISVK